MTRSSVADVAPAHTRKSRGWKLLAAVLIASALVLAGASIFASPYFALQHIKSAAAEGRPGTLARWGSDAGTGENLGALMQVLGSPDSVFEAGYEDFGRFTVRIRRAELIEPIRLVFRREGMNWLVSEIQEPPPPAPPGPRFGYLLSRAGTQPAELLADPELAARLRNALGAAGPAFRDAASKPGASVQLDGMQVVVNAPEAAMTFDVETGEITALLLNDGRLAVYSAKARVLEDLPKPLQPWLDRLVSDENANIPVYFAAGL